MDADIPPQYLKMEDLQAPSPTPATSSQSPPPTVIVRSVPAKKRKSWGQELPEPKTALPPRKRAKTEDEKEQRRIERIKRNRAAAHNSRERKRQETDNLAVLLAHANAKLDAYHKLHGPLPASVVLPDVQLSMDPEDAPTPALSTSASRHSYDATSPCSPVDTVMSTASPKIKRETTYDQPLLDLPSFTLPSPKSAPLPHLDAIQHSAEMLFTDLQCPSTRGRLATSASPSPSSTSPISCLTPLFLNLLIFNLQMSVCYRQLLTAIWTVSPSKMARMISLSTARLAAQKHSRLMTSSMKTRFLSRSTRPWAQLNAATGLVRPAREQRSEESRSLTGRGSAETGMSGLCRVARNGRRKSSDDVIDDGVGRKEGGLGTGLG